MKKCQSYFEYFDVGHKEGRIQLISYLMKHSNKIFELKKKSFFVKIQNQKIFANFIFGEKKGCFNFVYSYFCWGKEVVCIDLN